MLVEELEAALASDTAAAWRRSLNKAGVPAGRVLSVQQALSHPQIADRGLVSKFENVPGVGRDVEVAGAGFKIDGRAPRTEFPAPQLGEHTRDILSELGYTPEEIDALKQEKAI